MASSFPSDGNSAVRDLSAGRPRTLIGLKPTPLPVESPSTSECLSDS